jgi:hypothetical protein
MQIEIGEPFQDPEGHANGPFGIVLIRGACAEHRHRAVAQELVDRPPVALDLLGEDVVVRE